MERFLNRLARGTENPTPSERKYAKLRARKYLVQHPLPPRGLLAHGVQVPTNRFERRAYEKVNRPSRQAQFRQKDTENPRTKLGRYLKTHC